MENIIGVIEAIKQDHPHIIITDEMIKGIIVDYIDELVEEIRKEVSELQ